MQTIERVIVAEARTLLQNSKLRMKDLMEWSTSEDAIKRGLRDGELMFHLPDCGMWIAVKKEHSKIT